VRKPIWLRVRCGDCTKGVTEWGTPLKHNIDSILCKHFDSLLQNSGVRDDNLGKGVQLHTLQPKNKPSIGIAS